MLDEDILRLLELNADRVRDDDVDLSKVVDPITIGTKDLPTRRPVGRDGDLTSRESGLIRRYPEPATADLSSHGAIGEIHPVVHRVLAVRTENPRKWTLDEVILNDQSGISPVAGSAVRLRQSSTILSTALLGLASGPLFGRAPGWE